MRVNLSKALFALAALSMTACSSGSDGGGTSQVSNLITNTYSDVVTQAAKATGDIGSDAMVPVSTQGIVPFVAPDFGPAWDTTPSISNPVTNSGNITALDYMILQLTPDAVRDNGSAINVFGRMNMALQIFCIVGVGTGLSGVATDSAGYPVNGTHSLLISATAASLILTQCGFDASDMVGESVAVTVASASPTTTYDKVFTFSDFNQTYYIKSTSSVVNIATGEVHDGGTGQSRTVLSWDKATDVMLVEYVSAPAGTAGPTGLYGYRMFYDEANDDGQIFTYEGDNQLITNSIRYILAGSPQAGTNFSLSMKASAIEGGAKVDACINGETGAMFDDGDLCVGLGAAIDGSIDGVMTQFFADMDHVTWSTVTSATVLNWTDAAEMLTEDFDSTL